MTQSIRIIIAQLNFLVGDVMGNAQKMIVNIHKARDELKGDVIVFPELALTGYTPEDLLLRPGMDARIKQALDLLAKESIGIDVIVGHPHHTELGRFNAASLLRGGKIISTYHKRYLPNVEVFDEKRYFIPGHELKIIHIKNIPIALMICEDIWQPQMALQAKMAGAQLMIVPNASPFHIEKVQQRRDIVCEQAQTSGVPIVYVNLIGGQDELVFDGGSFVVNGKGEITLQAPFFKESLIAAEFTIENNHVSPVQTIVPELPSIESRIYDALVLGLRDYIEKNHFKSAVIGMSGGIDSALTAAIAVDAIGADRVFGVLMPSRYTRDISNIDARAQCELLNIQYQEISIEPVFNAFLNLLAEPFKGKPVDTTEENLQARCRGIILMALSNKFGHIVLSTGNKSELAVGYSTLYGDLVGGFCVLKDIWKTFVYRLAHYRNEISNVIPERVFTRAPSAELSEDQLDQDTLPDYAILDQILTFYIEQDEDKDAIIARGFDPKVVARVIQMVNRNEYKRRQAPIGICITTRAFGRDRRYPITSGYENQP
ncbi:MAG: NAD+ synthase [Gammaproteobacteria bacterium]|jgi:NAD+ synthase (glutamine-hydrolysing)